MARCQDNFIGGKTLKKTFKTCSLQEKKRVSFTKRVLNKMAFMGLCFLHGQVFSKMALEKEDVHFIHSLTEAVLKDRVLGTQGRDSTFHL